MDDIENNEYIKFKHTIIKFLVFTSLLPLIIYSIVYIILKSNNSFNYIKMMLFFDIADICSILITAILLNSITKTYFKNTNTFFLDLSIFLIFIPASVIVLGVFRIPIICIVFSITSTIMLYIYKKKEQKKKK